jgi:ubiquitin-protein ligase E3 C
MTKKKHPNIPSIVRLLTLPYDLYPNSPTVTSRLVGPFFHTLLAVPSLPSLMPLTSLTYFCAHLPLFSTVLPYAAAHPETLEQGALASERGKTELLANLVTLAVRGGMLARQKADGIAVWLEVVTRILRGVEDQWGLWLEGKGQWRSEDAGELLSGRQGQLANSSDSDVDVEGDVNTSRLPSHYDTRIRRRGVARPALSSKILPLIEATHLSTLITAALRNSALLLPFVDFVQSLLAAFRGSPRWEMILDALLEGENGKRLVRELWRGHVRGKWSRMAVKENWENMFSSKDGSPSPSKPARVLVPPFLLLSTLYIHHLLTLPDDEFFAPPSRSRSALSVDEVTELAGIWRDLAFYGYWTGVSAIGRFQDDGQRKAEERKREDVRGLMTRGVNAVCARE